MPVDRQTIIAVLQSNHLFEKMDARTLDALASQAELVELQKHQVIYRQGAQAGGLYIIVSGKVQLTQAKGNNQVPIGILGPGDYLGIEALQHRRWSHRAVALMPVTLLSLKKHNLGVLFHRAPKIKSHLKIALQSKELTRQASLGFLRPGEKVFFMARKHWVFLASRLVLPLAVLILSILGFIAFYLSSSSPGIAPGLCPGLFFILSIGWAAWSTFDWRNDYYLMTNQRIVWLEKLALFYDRRQEAPLSTILSVGVRTNQIGRIFGFGSVVIRSYTGIVEFRQVAEPEHVRAQIEEQWFRAKDTDRQEESRAIEVTIRQRLGFDEAVPGEAAASPAVSTAPASTYNPGVLPIWLSHLFNLRFENGSTITFRKHWFILIQQTWKPFLLVHLVFVGLVARLLGLITFLPLPAFLLGSFVLAAVLLAWLLYEYLDWHNDIFQLTSDQVVDVDRKPFGHEERRVAPLENILSIQFERRGLVSLLLNYGTVDITVGNTKLTFDNVYNPSQVQQDIFNQIAGCAARRKQDDVDAERERVAEWFAYYHQNIHPSSGGASPTPDSSGLNEF